jgi:hypothetical protein
MSKLIGVIISVVGWILNIFKTSGKDSRIRHDQKLADSIRKGKEREVSEEWKRRQKY